MRQACRRHLRPAVGVLLVVLLTTSPGTMTLLAASSAAPAHHHSAPSSRRSTPSPHHAHHLPAGCCCDLCLGNCIACGGIAPGDQALFLLSTAALHLLPRRAPSTGRDVPVFVQHRLPPPIGPPT